MGMLFGFDGLKLRPGEQLIGGNLPLAHFVMLLGEVGDALGDFLGVSQEEGYIERTGCIQDPDGGLQIGTFSCIGSPLRAFAQIKRQFGCSGGLSRQPAHTP